MKRKLLISYSVLKLQYKIFYPGVDHALTHSWLSDTMNLLLWASATHMQTKKMKVCSSIRLGWLIRVRNMLKSCEEGI